MTETQPEGARTMSNAQTSERVSSIAGRLVNMSPATLAVMAANDASCARLAQDIRTMAASLLRQDETKGVRGLFRKLIGK